ncbi:MAG: ATP-binding cassette domain-containing protein [Acidobacteria bacterium]|nr:ATP-binding cassette domain-containing protein [Acidobacteriota bacterium]
MVTAPVPNHADAAATPVVIDIRLRQGSFSLALHETIEARTVALFGPSGSGKTTTLAAVAGLRRPDDGVIRMGDRVLFDHARRIDVPPHDRRVGYVPQDLALFPHLDVRGNVMYGAREDRRPDGDDTGSLVTHASILELLEIDMLLDRPVDSLSGGERQRVALARALMTAPDLLLLDEPLAALDASLRGRILPYLERVRDELGTPMLYVSHSAEEVRRVAERVIVLDQGRTLRAGVPADVLPTVRADAAPLECSGGFTTGC